MPTCLYMHHMLAVSREADSLELELHVVVNHQVDVGSWTQDLCEGNAFNLWAISLALATLKFLKIIGMSYTDFSFQSSHALLHFTFAHVLMSLLPLQWVALCPYPCYSVIWNQTSIPSMISDKKALSSLCLKIWLYLIYLFCTYRKSMWLWRCVCITASMEVIGQLAGFGSWPLSCESWGFSSGHQAWWPVPLPAESSCQSSRYLNY